MDAKMTGFDLQEYAFRFPNRFDFDLAATVRLPVVHGVDLGQIVYGLCGGMCCSAADHFMAGLPVLKEEKVTALSSRFILYLWDRQIESLGGLTILEVIAWMLRSDADAARATVRIELPKLKRRINAGKPVVLALIREGGVGNPTLNHQVLAIGYEDDISGKVTKIHLYEPNYPKRKVWLTVDRSEKTPVLSQSTKEKLRGFFLIDYEQKPVYAGERSLSMMSPGLVNL